MAKEIDYSKFSKEQLEAARLMTDFSSKMTNKEIAEAVGISERQFYRWKEDREFLDLVNDLSDKYMDANTPQIYRQLMKAVNGGSVKAIELALKRAGKLVERREVVSEVDLEVTGLDGKTNDQLLEEIAKLEKAALQEGSDD
ncbi:phBC6A51 family helix-turn-helix protein [Bacillus cereus group sp. BceL300]|uniref:phBC6A51 family helix-turn-helix protein n=1 Tax=Bacillus cereus group TaxID=86661 RepID=UPI0032F4BEBD|nr:helix-turn-helix domain-containing protein [Bacillus cereus]HDR8014965.1 helix-turn-helix domain-containing protein [Bacillus cereus]